MNAFFEPSGPLPPSVYWRRRAIVLVVLALIVAGGWAMLTAFTSGSTPTPTASATPGAAVACNPDDIALRAETNQDAYAEGEFPQFAMTITNTGDAPCTLEVGTDKQKYVITSGTDMIWDSTVCQTGEEPYTQELTAGQSVTTSAAVPLIN